VALAGSVRCKRSAEDIERVFGECLRGELDEPQAALMVQWLALNTVAHWGAPRPYAREQSCHDVAVLYLPHARRVLADNALEQIRGPLRTSIHTHSYDVLAATLALEREIAHGRFYSDETARLHVALRHRGEGGTSDHPQPHSFLR
jgi:hypothetical protein